MNFHLMEKLDKENWIAVWPRLLPWFVFVFLQPPHYWFMVLLFVLVFKQKLSEVHIAWYVLIAVTSGLRCVTVVDRNSLLDMRGLSTIVYGKGHI